MKIRLLSYNTQHCQNYLTKKIDYDIFVRTIKECGADVVGLNEMRGKGESADYEDQTAILAQKTGFYHYFAKAIDVHGVNPYGNAILSRYPILSAKTIPIPDPEEKKEGCYYETRCALIAKIAIGEKVLNVVITHFGLNEDEKENAVSTVLSATCEKNCVLMGDFNVEPDCELLAPIRKAMRDSADKIDGNELTFPSDKPRMKIDYIYASKDINVISARILDVITSDHRPHFAEIEI